MVWKGRARLCCACPFKLFGVFEPLSWVGQRNPFRVFPNSLFRGEGLFTYGYG